MAQFVEGKIKNCAGRLCGCTCCDDDEVDEWMSEYMLFHERIKDYLISFGIKIKFKDDRVSFENCSDGVDCKFLKYSLNKDIDARPIDCKIYPFVVDWDKIDFDKKIVHLYYWDDGCPLVKECALPEEFRKEVESIIKRDFTLLFYGARFEVKFHDVVYKKDRMD